MVETNAAMRDEPLPWHALLWDQVAAQLQRLPHALLLSGQAGLGKQAFAQRLIQALLCEQPGASAQACGQCHGCRLLQAGTHPDLLTVRPAEAGKPIVVDSIRALGKFLALRPHLARHKLCLITPAEAMNANAANSLLKLLEEPPLGSILLLVSHQPRYLPVTVRSRCSVLSFQAPASAQALAWLQQQDPPPTEPELLLPLAGQSPLTALALHEQGFLAMRQQLLEDVLQLRRGQSEPLGTAQRWVKSGAQGCMQWFQGWVADIIKIALVPTSTRLYNPDQSQALQDIADGLQLNQLFSFQDALGQGARLLSGPVDELLLVEDLLIRWTKLK